MNEIFLENIRRRQKKNMKVKTINELKKSHKYTLNHLLQFSDFYFFSEWNKLQILSEVKRQPKKM
jgi:hypothetical protein